MKRIVLIKLVVILSAFVITADAYGASNRSPQQSRDVAITNISAPSSCVQGDTVSVVVNVENQGDSSEEVHVALTDVTNGLKIGSQSVTLSAAGKGGIDEKADVIINAEGTGVQQFGNYPHCGDVNGDGCDDLLVTAAYWNNNNKQGRAYIYLGSKNGIDNKPDWIVTGENTGDYFGEGCALGDINADGYDDVVIGAPGYNNMRGRAYIFFGGPDIDNKADVILEGEPGTTGAFGREVYIGYIDDDKYADLMINAMLYNSATGRVYLFYGGEPFDSGADKIIDGEAPGDRIGREGHIGKDVNGDGYGDILLGARAWDNETGRAYLFYGGTRETMDTVCDKVFTGEARGDRLGCDVCLADIDNDGLADVLIGAPRNRGQGRVYLCWGAADMDTKPDLILNGQEGVNSRFGHQIAAGYFNTDDYPDFVVGAFGYRYFSERRGGVYLFYGNERASINTMPDVIFTGEESRSYFSTRNAVGDFNGDNLDDLYIAAVYYPNNTRQGRGYIYYNNPYPSRDIKLNWDTTNTLIGDHILKAEIVTVAGEEDTADNTMTITVNVKAKVKEK